MRLDAIKLDLDICKILNHTNIVDMAGLFHLRVTASIHNDTRDIFYSMSGSRAP